MVKELIKGKIVINKKGDFFKILDYTTNKELVSLKLINQNVYIYYITIDDFMNNYYDIDLSDKFVMDIYLKHVNRSLNQTKFLLELINNDYNKLIDLENKIKNNFISYCPGTIDRINEILSIKEDKVNLYNFDIFKNKVNNE